MALQVPEEAANQPQVSTTRTDSGQVSILEPRGVQTSHTLIQTPDSMHTMRMCWCMISSSLHFCPVKKGQNHLCWSDFDDVCGVVFTRMIWATFDLPSVGWSPMIGFRGNDCMLSAFRGLNTEQQQLWECSNFTAIVHYTIYEDPVT